MTQSGYGAKGVPILDPTGKGETQLIPEIGTLRTQDDHRPCRPEHQWFPDRPADDGSCCWHMVLGFATFTLIPRGASDLVGSSYLLPGDSGGPTFAVIDNALREVGVHADSERLLDLNGDTVARQGFVLNVNGSPTQRDKTPYIDFINKACKDDVARLSVRARDISLMIG